MVKKGNDELIEKLNSAIDELLADGTVKEISEKYFGHGRITAIILLQGEKSWDHMHT